MRAVGRVVLILLIPAALGLACLVEFLERRGWVRRRLGRRPGVPGRARGDDRDVRCGGEPGADHGPRERIDRGRVAFYYHPCERQPFLSYQLDAMWASLATGVPTINGYSGYAPRDWHRFFCVDFESKNREVADVLAEWERMRGLSPDRVQWIGADCPSKKSLREAERAAELAPAQDAAEQ